MTWAVRPRLLNGAPRRTQILSLLEAHDEHSENVYTRTVFFLSKESVGIKKLVCQRCLQQTSVSVSRG